MPTPRGLFPFAGLVLGILLPYVDAGASLHDDARRALREAIEFFQIRVASQGGYVWKYSADLRHRQGEGVAPEHVIWVQPPGTPAVATAMLEAYEVTGIPAARKGAVAASEALVQGQLHSGGWDYSITFDPEERREVAYRRSPTKGKPDVQNDDDAPGGWEVWSRREHKANMTILDDDTTQSALRLLMKVDQALDFEDSEIHAAVEYGLGSLIRVQYPVGAWSHNYDRFPKQSPDADYYPVTEATYPESWSREWSKEYSGCYMLNDRITLDAIETLLLARRIYGDEDYRDAAVKGGEFLLRAQMPDPQPAWAQQYDRSMQPVWDRSFEPPAISGRESQDVLETLLNLYAHTGQQRFLNAVPKALVYLRRSERADGMLARFYELKTNRPLYFTEDYELTYEADEMPSHYGFVVASRLDRIVVRYRQLARKGPNVEQARPTEAELAAEARRVIREMDDRGAWTEPGWVRNRDGEKVEPDGGIILSKTFIENVKALTAFLAATGETKGE